MRKSLFSSVEGFTGFVWKAFRQPWWTCSKKCSSSRLERLACCSGWKSLCCPPSSSRQAMSCPQSSSRRTFWRSATITSWSFSSRFGNRYFFGLSWISWLSSVCRFAPHTVSSLWSTSLIHLELRSFRSSWDTVAQPECSTARGTYGKLLSCPSRPRSGTFRAPWQTSPFRHR